MYDVFWVVEKELAGRAGPIACAWDLAQLRRGGFRSVVTLHEGEVTTSQIREAGLEPVPLYLPPLILDSVELKVAFVAEVPRFVATVESLRGRNRLPALVHCHMGRDRTCAMLACYLVERLGIDAREAVERIRAVRPSAFFTEGYEDCVHLFAASPQRRPRE